MSTASEVVALLEHGVRGMEFFPARAAGGTAYPGSPAGPLPQARFCPTGGTGPATAPGYPSLPDVGRVGGSRTVPADAVAAGDRGRVEDPGRGGAQGRRCDVSLNSRTLALPSA